MKKTTLTGLALALTLALTACSGGGADNTATDAGDTGAAQTETTNSATEGTTEEAGETATAATDGEPTRDNPIVVDKENKTVKVYAEVNEKYKDKPTMHLVVSESGKEGDHAMFKSAAKALDFHDALKEAGLEAGNNVTTDNAGEVQVEGDALDMTFRFQGDSKDYSVDEVVDDSSNTPIDMRFGGNYETQKDMDTGCIACLMSCPAGIVSNHAHKLGDDKKENFRFTINKDHVPADKTPVVVSFVAK